MVIKLQTFFARLMTQTTQSAHKLQELALVYQLLPSTIITGARARPLP